MKTKTFYYLRIRGSDNEPWGEPTEYESRRKRDYDEKVNRIIGGLRTQSYQLGCWTRTGAKEAK